MKLRNILIVICFGLLIQSCAPAYMPSAVNVPMLQQKRDGFIAVRGGTSGLDPQAAYAITNHVGAMLNTSFANKAPSSDTSTDFSKHISVELAPGYFTRFGKNYLFELYGGMGYGANKFKYYNINSVDNNAIRYFVQPSVARVGQKFDLGATVRITNFNVFFSNNEGCVHQWFAEPALTAKVGGEKIKFVAQAGTLFTIGSIAPDITHKNYMLTGGVQYSLFNSRKDYIPLVEPQSK